MVAVRSFCIVFFFLACGGEEEAPVIAPPGPSLANTESAEETPEAEASAAEASAAEANPSETNAAEASAAETPEAPLAEAPPVFAAAGPAATFGGPSETGDGWVELQRLVETTIVASSNYRDDPDQVAKLTDDDFRTAWNSATMAEGDTTSQTLTLTLPEGVRVHAIGFTAGYTKIDGSRDLFTMNRRLTDIVVRHGEHSTEAILLEEDRDIQDIEIPAEDFPGEHGGEWVIELRGWVQGSRADWRELAISELRILGEVGSATAREPSHPDAAAMQAFGEAQLGRYHQADMTAFDARSLVGPPTLQTVSLANPLRRVPITLPSGHCYAIVVHVHRRVGGHEAPIYLFGEAATGEGDRYEADSTPGLFMIGLDEALCAREGVIRNTLDFSDISAIEATIAVFEQGTDPQSFADDNSADLPIGVERPAAPSVAIREGLHLTRLVIASMVEGREPLDALQVYNPDMEERAYCYFELANPSEEATQLQLSWVDDEGESRREPTTIDVPARRRFVHYRYTTLASRRPGAYACVLRDSGGVELGRGPFQVVASMDDD